MYNSVQNKIMAACYSQVMKLLSSVKKSILKLLGHCNAHVYMKSKTWSCGSIELCIHYKWLFVDTAGLDSHDNL